MRLTPAFAPLRGLAMAMLVATFAPTAADAQLAGTESSLRRGFAQLDELQPVAPYKVSSRFHLLEGTASGYLVLQFELPKGSHIYSLNQAGAIKPTKITVAKSDAFIVDGKFNPDKPAEIIEQDPVFQQRVEKHKGKVQFFVPVKFNDVTKVASAVPELIVNGQVCSDEGVCLPIRDKRVKAEFGGFFGRTVEVPQAPTGPLVR